MVSGVEGVHTSRGKGDGWWAQLGLHACVEGQGWVGDDVCPMRLVRGAHHASAEAPCILLLATHMGAAAFT